MDFSSSYIRPGQVVEVVDNYGTIKATSPGIFSVDDDHELLPPIIPFIQGTSGNFTSPLVDDIVWIMHDKTNTQLFYYLRLNQLNDSVKKLLDSGDANQEIVFSRDTDNGLYQLFFNDGTGIKFLKDGNYICIDPKGNIDIVTERSNRSISLSADSICLGKSVEEAGNCKHYVAYGDEVEKALNIIKGILNQMKTIASANPYTSPLVAAFATLPQLETQITKITSDDVKVV